MTMTRRIGAIAALGGMAAAAALWAGLPGARADELSQLKANQQILQQELSKLQQEAKLTAAPVPPGSPSLAGSFPRSFLIPGTNTSISIGGYVELDASDFVNGGSNNSNAAVPPVTGQPIAAGAPLREVGSGLFAAPPFNPSAFGHNVFQMQASESRFFIETRTPTSYGEAITHLELDLFGCTAGNFCGGLNRSTNPDVPRLRLAYGSLGGFLAGQDWVPVNDLDASPTIFDFGGDAGIFGYARAPQIRYTGHLPYGLSYIVAAVEPVTSVFTPVGATQSDAMAGVNGATTALAVNPTKTRLPDGNFVLKLTRPWGEVSFKGVVRELTLQDGRFVNKDFIGYGGGISAHMVPFPGSRDNFGFDLYAGDGLGHYNSSPTGSVSGGTDDLATNFGGAAVGGYGTCNANTPACLAIDSKANGAQVLARTIPGWGAEANYQHWWKFAPGWRSTISGGILHQDVPTTLVGLTAATVGYNKELWTAHANIMYSPVAFIDTGLEYSHDHRLTIFNQSGTANVVMFAFRVRF